ncbi:MAG: rod shape-determining protein MreC [Actinomycetota bacterium]|nr:rod shape-determining protein MreC [Actinomycetota bacterium]
MVILNRRIRNLIILAIIIFLCLVIITASFRQSEIITNIKSKTIDFFKPIQEKFFSLFSPVIGFFNSVRDYINLREKYLDLQAENSRLREEYVENVNLRVENNSLRKLLDMKLREGYETITARVIGFNQESWKSEVILNAGVSEGACQGMGVLSEEGLVGIIINSGSDSCNVRLINDPRSSIGVRILSSRKLGVLKGSQDGKITLNYIPAGETVFKGDIIITSEYGNLPGEILVGRISKVSEDGDSLYKIIEVEPFADLKRLEYVLILEQ